MGSFVLVILLCFLVPSPGFASGSEEGEPASSPATGVVETRVRAFILAEAENDGNRMYTERVAIPEAASLTRWTRFSRVGREVKMESAVTLSLREKRMSAQSLSSGVIVQAFEMVALGLAEPGSTKRPVRVEVSFSVKDCLTRQGKVLYQPARMAVTRAVLEANRGTGEARLLEITEAGPGRFSAVVELR